MVAVAKESVGAGKDEPKRDKQEDSTERKTGPEKGRKLPWADVACFYCQGKGHVQRFCKKRQMDEAIEREQDTLERILKGDQGDD